MGGYQRLVTTRSIAQARGFEWIIGTPILTLLMGTICQATKLLPEPGSIVPLVDHRIVETLLQYHYSYLQFLRNAKIRR